MFKKKITMDLKNITNIKNLQNDIKYTDYYLNYCDSLIDDILNIKEKNLLILEINYMIYLYII